MNYSELINMEFGTVLAGKEKFEKMIGGNLGASLGKGLIGSLFMD